MPKKNELTKEQIQFLKECEPVSMEDFDNALKRLLNTPPRTYKQIVEEGREERKRLGIKMLTPKMRAMSQEELLKYIEQRNLKNAKKYERQQARENKKNFN